MASHSSGSPPPHLSDVVAIAAGSNHSVALTRQGTIVAWGQNGFGQSTVPAGLSEVVAIDAVDSYTHALKSDGTLVGMGKWFAGTAFVPAGPPAGLT